ncbi:hypothetical protein [Pseudorhodoplanes sp.]|uniref:hypothetical protein n=1 Tax=Pseudorhodoplanes sp. TaxID=1934341 RepID=UPI002B690680|nr:hypothetical protein [Pseudorhodoplanes sp.]HWV55057.1 hypothetical protein [Pseudorhodoplanes sp.]
MVKMDAACGPAIRPLPAGCRLDDVLLTIIQRRLRACLRGHRQPRDAKECAANQMGEINKNLGCLIDLIEQSVANGEHR